MFIIEETLNACFAAGGPNLPMPSWAPQDNETLLLAVINNQPVLSVHGVTGNGLVWAQIADVNNARGAMGMSLFRASSPATPTPGSVTFTTVSNKPVKAILTRVSGGDITTDDGIGAIGTAPGGVSDNADLKVDVTPILNGAFILAFAGHSQVSRSIVDLPIGQSIIFQDSTDCGAGFSRLRSHFWKKDDPVNPAALVTMGKDASLNASAPWTAIAIALSPVLGAPVIENPEFLVITPDGSSSITKAGSNMCRRMTEGTADKFFLIDRSGPIPELFPVSLQAAIPFSASLSKCIANGNVIAEFLFKP